MVLVGDSVADNVLGYEDTLQVTIADMVHHVGAVARAKPSALVIGDMPWMSYHLEPAGAVRNAARLVRAGAEAVKLEGGQVRVAVVEAIIRAEIPVMGHLGLTPQSVLAMGGYRVQAKNIEAAQGLLAAAKALVEAGCFALVLEGVPDVVAAAVTEAIEIPTIGIGAGPACDGQVMVFHDLLGLGRGPVPRFVRPYADVASVARAAVAAFAADVREGTYPSEAESYRASEELRAALPATVGPDGSRGVHDRLP
jgi:3-methyl-2-oxobutanoate hydroxymethyltransferase